MATAEEERLKGELAALRAENRYLREQLDAALDGTGLCLWQGDVPSGHLAVINAQDASIHDPAPDVERWIGKLHPDDRAQTLAAFRAHLAGETPCYQAEYRTVRADGHTLWLWDRGRVVERDDEGRPLRILGAHIDITQRKEHEAQLARMAHHDPLTGLPNRRLLLNRLKTDAAGAGHGLMVLAMLDIDHFKLFNDRYGHDVGDQVLIDVAKTISAQLRREDLCVRWGGEEFLLLLFGVTPDEAERIVGRVHQALHRLTPGAAGASVTASIGMATYRPGEAFTLTIKRADDALLNAKRSGRNRICHA